MRPHLSIICTELYLILEFFNDGLMMVFLDRNMLSFFNKMNVVMFDGNIAMCFKFMNTTGCPL